MSKFLVAFLLIAPCSCRSQIKKHKVDSAATALNDSAMALIVHNTADSYRKAVILLDSATTIDSNFFLGYWNKVSCLTELKEFKKAIVSVKSMIRIRPKAPDLYESCGSLYDLTGDSNSADGYFKKFLTLYDAVLDTMSIKNRDYDMLYFNKAIALIMAGDQAKGNMLLKVLYDRETDSDYKEMIGSTMNKSRRELIESMMNGSWGNISGEVRPTIGK